MGAHVFNGFCHIHPSLQGVHWADGVRNGALGVWQNLLGYRHYSDDVVRQFIERCAENGVSVFRIFDAMNDMRNLKTAVDQTVKLGQHAQGTISYTVSPVHTLKTWVDMAKAIEDRVLGMTALISRILSQGSSPR
jgi:pyruvate/oxaloacetate carboxyltransferase